VTFDGKRALVTGAGASDEAAFVTGTALVIDGRLTAA
jgi:hypothetical protein